MIKMRKDGKDYYESHPWYHFVDPRVYLKDYKIINYMRVEKKEVKEENVTSGEI